MRKVIVIFVGVIVGTCLFSCVKEDVPKTPNFLQDLRGVYFEQLNFNEEKIIKDLPVYLEQFTDTYDLLEQSYRAGTYKIEADLKNMNLANFYFSSLLTAITKAYLDGILSFEQILGEQRIGLFSKKSKEDTNFEQVEMEALASRAVEVSKLGLYINGKNDRSYGAYVAAGHVYGRLVHPDKKNSDIEQRKMIDYALIEIEDFAAFPVWNLLMSITYFDNYEDESNTFQNPEMDTILDRVITRLDPLELPIDNSNFTSLLVPIYQMDLVMKKIDWMIHREEELSKKDIQDITAYIFRLEIIDNTIMKNGQEALNQWDFQPTYRERLHKVTEIKDYLSEIKSNKNTFKPKLAPFFQSKNFRQAYQCYSCHKSLNL